ncbi:MAG: aspartate carbamoyltransferase catalytic subunit [Candidatus Margulisbacteria bacterium]|nr:aspartate carbamoyltransferase catalytic subunit [Candidatus Margulisiibacteriota bacterium]
MNYGKTNKKKNLLGLKDLSRQDIENILQQATLFKEIFNRPVKKLPTLQNKVLVPLFYEASTRTKASFDMAMKMLGAGSLGFAVQTSSISKGETLIDTVKNLESMGIDGIIVRHNMAGAAQLIANNVNISVINAGDGFNEHPTQALLDMFTMIEEKGYIEGKKVAIIGDIYHSRVARSNIWGLTKLGAKVVVCGPPSLIPEGIETMGVTVTHKVEEAIDGADFINVLRVQFERQKGNFFPSVREYYREYGITPQRLKKAKDDVILMHPGPMNRGIEISTEVADGPYNVILEQVKNGVSVRMAVLYLLLMGGL